MISLRVKEVLSDGDMSQRAFARACGLSESMVRWVISGKCKCHKEETLEALEKGIDKVTKPIVYKTFWCKL